jgi:hypothetical protein
VCCQCVGEGLNGDVGGEWDMVSESVSEGWNVVSQYSESEFEMI